MADLITLSEIIHGINNKNVLLPHFQREYVWNRSQQKKLILSVLTGLPSSSSLILKKQTDDRYKCLKIGMRDEVITEFGEGDSYYLLDGQQRFTTLYYAFYNIFRFDKSLNENEFEKLDNKLKKRWYLKFTDSKNYLLNYDNLVYDQKASENLLPEDIESFIIFEELSKLDLKDHKKDMELIEEKCKDKKMVPLFFILENKTEVKRILKKIFDDRLDEIKSKEENLKSLEDLLRSKNFENAEEKVIRYFKNDEGVEKEIDNFIEENGFKDDWVDGIFEHFQSYLKDYEIQPIKMDDRNKAVKTFEYINTGGTNLSSFDLLCAKVGNFDLRNLVICETKKEFSFFNSDFSINKNFQLYDEFGLIGGNDKNPSLEKKYAEYLSQVLNLLHFKKIKNKNPNDKEFSGRLLKSNYSLDELYPDFIEKNYNEAVEVIKKSVALLQVFCAHKNLNSITNYLSLIQIFTFFIYWNKPLKKEQLKKLIGQFWLKLFIGRYDSHQSENSIKDAMELYNLIFYKNDEITKSYKKSINIELFSDEGFASKSQLTSRKNSKSLEDNLFMFLRSNGEKFLDLDVNTSKITIEDDIEIHHIIPISNAAKVGDSSRLIRQDDKHLLNATMNKTPIKKSTNRSISNKNIYQYCADLKTFNTQFNHHFINSSWAENSFTSSNEEKIKELFERRFDSFTSEIRKKIDSYIND